MTFSNKITRKWVRLLAPPSFLSPGDGKAQLPEGSPSPLGPPGPPQPLRFLHLIRILIFAARKMLNSWL